MTATRLAAVGRRLDEELGAPISREIAGPGRLRDLEAER